MSILQSYLFLPVKDLWTNKAFQREACRYVSACVGGSSFIPLSEKGAVDGVATLDSGGLVPLAQLPFSSPLDYHGNWDANANTPPLTATTGITGDMYICNVSGSQSIGEGTKSYAVGDVIVADENGNWIVVGSVGGAHVNGTGYLRAIGTTLYYDTTIAETVLSFSDITTNNASSTKHGFLPKLSNSATQYLDGTGSWSTPAGGGGGGGSIDDLTGATLHTITDADNFVFDGDNGTIQTITLGASRTFTIADLKVGIPYTFIVKQDATGSRVLTWSTTTKVAYAGAGTPAISTTANAIDIYKLISDGTNIYCDYALNYS